MKENRLLSQAYQRGFRYVTSVAYLESLEKQWKSGDGEYAHWSFTPVYEHPASGLRVYGIAPKPGPG